MVSAEILINYPDCKIPLIVHTAVYEKLLGAVISQNRKPISFLTKNII